MRSRKNPNQNTNCLPRVECRKDRKRGCRSFLAMLDSARASLDWSFKGMRTLLLENRLLKVSVLLDKGSDIFELIYKPLDIDLIWHSPIGYRNPKAQIQNNTSPADIFHDYYGGGWNDIFPNYGNPSQNRGARFVGHGESSLLPWSCSYCGEENGIVNAKLSVDCVRYPIRAEKNISLDSTKPVLAISEDIINLSDQQVEISWAQHIAYGEPFINKELQIQIPAIRAKTSTFDVPYSRLAMRKEFKWPSAPSLDGNKVDVSKIPPRNARVQEDFPIVKLHSCEYKLYNAKLDLGVKVSWNRKAFPVLWYWLNWGTPDYPFFGKARTLALEPTTSSMGNGLADDIENGSAIVLEPNSKLHGAITMRIFRKGSD
jgi:Domain of unknown function (DUF4432)